MKYIAINILYNPSGGALKFINQFLSNLGYEDDVKWIIYARKSFVDKMPRTGNITIKSYATPDFGLVCRFIFEQLIFPIILFRDKISVVFSPGNICPLLYKGKQVVWVGTIGPWCPEFNIKNLGIKKYLRSRINKIMMAQSMIRATHVIFESNYAKYYFTTLYKIRDSNTSVLKVGVDDNYLHKLNSTKDVSDDFLICVSHLYPYKKVEDLVSAVFILKSRGVSLPEIKIIGSAPSESYHKKLVKMIEKYNIDNIIFTGAVSYEKLVYYYRNAKFMVFTSTCENWAYTLVEAITNSCPIICTNQTSMGEAIGPYAIYYKAEEPQDLANAMQYSLENPKILRQNAVNALEAARNLPTAYQTAGAVFKIVATL